jgi:hypothetical protein
MRRFLNTGLESFHGESLGNENISMEEEAILIEDAGSDAEGADKELSEAERIIEVSDALEDMAVAVSGEEPLTEREAMIVETAGQMAVAGTDIEPEEIVPSMEGFVGRQISTEGFREKARQIWEAILRFLKQIWEKIEGFFYKIFGTIPRMRKTIKALEEKVENANRKTIKEKKFNVSSVKYLTHGATQVKDASGLNESLGKLQGTADYLYGGYLKDLKDIGGDIIKALEEFDPTKPAEAADALAPKLQKFNLRIPGASGAGGSRWPRYNVKAGHDLLGGVSLFARSPKDSTKAGTLGSLEIARAAGVELAPSQEKAKALPATIEFATMSTTDAIRTLQHCEKLLDAMEEFQRGKGHREVKDERAKLEAASKKAESAASKLDKNEASEAAAASYYRALLNFNVSYARWIQQPLLPFTKNALQVVRTAMVVVDRSMGQYE